MLLAEETPRALSEAADAPEPDHRIALMDRIEKAKRSFTCRRAHFEAVSGFARTLRPRSGDVLLATVTEVGHHARIETPEGRRAQLYPGDEILVAYGSRYAPDQFEAVVPNEIGPCDLVAGGGVAARVVARHSSTRKPTAISPIGVLVDEGGDAINLRQFALAPPARTPWQRNVVAVVGTSMNAGKTTAAAHIIRGLTDSGVRVGACKVTGTGSGGDLWSMIDAGAVRAIDFTDAGYSTTAGADLDELQRAALMLVSELEAVDVDIVVVEIADGLLQRETSSLLSPPSKFASRIDALLLAASDSMGAVAGARWLQSRQLPLRAVTGLMTSSPLASKEAHEVLGVDIVETKQLARANLAAKLCLQASSRHPRSVI